MAPRKPKLTVVPPRDHNEAAAEEADRVQLISIISKLSDADAEIERAKGPLKAAQAQRKRIIGLGKAAGFSAGELKARLEEMKEDSRDQEERIRRETQHRKWLGIIRPDQPSLNLDGQTPEEVRDMAYYAAEGYKAGLLRLAAVPPDGIPERFVQTWLAERARGAAELLIDEGEPTVAQQAANDFAEDNPEIDVEAAARKLKAKGFTERSESFEADFVTEVIDDRNGLVPIEEELEAQKPRLVVHASRVCTCPADQAPTPCAQRFALDECLKAHEEAAVV